MIYHAESPNDDFLNHIIPEKWCFFQKHGDKTKCQAAGKYLPDDRMILLSVHFLRVGSGHGNKI